MKSFLVIGLGGFGRHLARELSEMGNEVMVVDRDEERVTAMASTVTATYIGDCQDEQVLASLGVDNFDVCFVCISDDFQCSLEVSSTLKELGAKYVVARADREKQIRFLKKIGADFVVHAEMDMAVRIATRFSVRNVFEYFELTPQYAILEIETPSAWVGKTVMELNVRSRYNINILAVKHQSEVIPLVDPHYRFEQDTHLIIAGDKHISMRLMEQI